MDDRSGLDLVLQAYGDKNRSVHIYDDYIHVEVKVIEINGGQVRLKFFGPKDVAIDRDVVYRKKVAERKQEEVEHGEPEHDFN